MSSSNCRTCCLIRITSSLVVITYYAVLLYIDYCVVVVAKEGVSNIQTSFNQ